MCSITRLFAATFWSKREWLGFLGGKQSVFDTAIAHCRYSILLSAFTRTLKCIVYANTSRQLLTPVILLKNTVIV